MMKINITKRLNRFLAVAGAMLIGALPALAQESSLTRVAANDCGVPGAQPFLVKGENYTMPSEVKGSKEAITCNFGGKVIYAFNQLDIHADYQLEVVYLADHERKQRIVVDGNEIQNVTLEAGKEQRYLLDLPRKAYAYSQLVLVFEVAGKGANAIVSELNLYSSNSKAPVPFKGKEKEALGNVLTYHIDTDVDVEKVLPVYTVLPKSVTGTYRPVLSLNGTWQFNPQPEKEFYKHSDSSGWKSVIVPGQWSMQGFKVDSMAYAGYRKSFVLPEDWKDKNVKLRFDGVHSEYYVYLNGVKAGYHLGGMTVYEIDVTKHLKLGVNELALAVRSESLADMLGSLTQYAAHQLGGITRKVTLMAVPQTHVSDVRIVTDLDSEYRNAALKIETAVVNKATYAQNGLTLRLSVNGLPNVIEQRLPKLAVGEVWKGILSDTVTAPLLWNNEQPHLYTLRMELCLNDEVIETVEKRFGFREIEVRGNELFVNGRAVKLRGGMPA